MPLPVIHELMSPRVQREFHEYAQRVGKRIGSKLPEELKYPYIAIGFLLQRHSESDPRKPEFPPGRERFPATPTLKVAIPGLEHLDVRIKDESRNPVTGTHKDRKSWEWALAQYRMIDEMLRAGKTGDLPHLSMISSGNTAVSQGRMNALFKLPPVHTLVDDGTSERKIVALKENNVKAYATDLKRRELDSDDVLALTRNRKGVDLSLGKFAKSIMDYDWHAYEILNQKPDVVIVPYGTGELYDNIRDVYLSEIRRMGHDPRLLVRKRGLHGLHLIGVTAEHGSPADKLTAPFLPESSLAEVRRTKANVITQNIRAGFLGERSGIHAVQDGDLHKAKAFADKMGLKAEYSALAGLAWLLRNGNSLKKGSRVVIVSTGKGILED